LSAQWRAIGICAAPFLFLSANLVAAPDAAVLKRFMAIDENRASHALQHGGKLIRKTTRFTILFCPPEVGTTSGFEEDIPVHGTDVGANDQIQASRLQSLDFTGRGRKIVVLDTGYNYNHPELRSSYLGGYDFSNYDNDPMDDHGHGSHVAGLITADGISGNARGVAPETGIIAGKVLDSSNNGFLSDVIDAIYWAVDGPDRRNGTADDFHPDGISISIGTKAPYVYRDGNCDTVSPALTTAEKYAVDHGVPVVIGAGNNGNSGVSLPGCVSYAITVGAVGSDDAIASFSGRGDAVDIVAPGVLLYSAHVGMNYALLSGTSQATPIVAGVIALMKEAYPNASVEEVEAALFSTAVPVGASGKDTTYGWGRVDAYQALYAIFTPDRPDPPAFLSIKRATNNLILSWPKYLLGYSLESASAIVNSMNWQPVTNTNVDPNVATVPITTGEQFFRLRKP